jgi:hypothetical protein
MPFVLLLCFAGWLTYASEGTNDLASVGAALAFAWLFVANFLLNAVVRHRGARFGRIDLSRNVAPSSIEMLLRRLIRHRRFCAGGPRRHHGGERHCPRHGSENRDGRGGFPLGRGLGVRRLDPCGHRAVRISDSTRARVNVRDP